MLISKSFIIANLGYRIQGYHRNAIVTIGEGNPNADIVVVQPHNKMPDRDSITGALKRFGMLENSYRATIKMVEYESGAQDSEGNKYPCLIQNNLRGEKPQTELEINRDFLHELIDIIDPIVVVSCGQEVTELLRERKIRSFKTHTGKKFRSPFLLKPICYATLNPMDYGFAKAPQYLKDQGKKEWADLARLYSSLKEKAENERWAC